MEIETESKRTGRNRKERKKEKSDRTEYNEKLKDGKEQI